MGRPRGLTGKPVWADPFAPGYGCGGLDVCSKFGSEVGVGRLIWKVSPLRHGWNQPRGKQRDDVRQKDCHGVIGGLGYIWLLELDSYPEEQEVF